MLNGARIVKLLLKIKHQQVNKMNIQYFNDISIRGRFIYGYLCFRNSIQNSNSNVIPLELNQLFEEFVVSEKLDAWHTKVEDVLPSFILNVEQPTTEYFDNSVVNKIKQYYCEQPPFIAEIIENLFWLGISNLYVAYSSENSLKYLKAILEIMDSESLPLPDFGVIERCSASQRHGWGESDSLSNYI